MLKVLNLSRLSEWRESEKVIIQALKYHNDFIKKIVWFHSNSDPSNSDNSGPAGNMRTHNNQL